ncbi:MAG: CoA-disulfide reductase, partial [Actinobacteria bacterium]|nr:CoA-disulfide reductase [Actinomycetota bacterium]
MRVVIIGGVAGGMSAATRLRRLDPEAEIIVFEKSGHVSYANCGLPYYVGGVIENESDLLLQTPESLHKRFRLDVRVSTEVLAINAAAHTLTLKNLHSSETSEMSYDKLILSPGANPVVPPIPGVERALTLRNIEDVERIAGAVATKPRNAVVIGGGFIGVEIAENLVHKKIPTVVIEAAPQVLAPLDPEMATFVAEEITKHGIDLRLGSGVASISESSVTLSDGSVLPADLIILSIGVKPEIGLAKAAGLDITSRGAVAVNDF